MRDTLETVTLTSPVTVTEIRVTYAEVDKMGVAYYGNYFRWFEIGRAEFIRARGTTYRDVEEQGAFLPVIAAYARYRESATYDDLLEIHAAAEEIGAVRLKFAYHVFRKKDQVLLVEGYTVHACTGANGHPKRFPKDLLERLRSHPI